MLNHVANFIKKGSFNLNKNHYTAEKMKFTQDFTGKQQTQLYLEDLFFFQ